MNKKEEILFQKLKQDIAKAFLEEYSTINQDISQWKGIEITYFQEHLLKKVKGTVSEKWFYTYFKSNFEKLPRVDMLNLLSIYAGYKSWNDFIAINKEVLSLNEPFPETTGITPTSSYVEEKESIPIKNNKQRAIRYSIISFLSLLVLGIIYYFIAINNTYTFCFVDADRNTPIKNNLEISILRKNFAPAHLTTNTGKIDYRTYEDTLLLVANSAFYKKDTFLINLNQYNGTEYLELRQDDYAVMLYYYSKTDIDLNKRKKELESLISDRAVIHQIYDNEEFGMEILSKEQYINFLLLPTTSLKNYVLINSEMKNNKITRIKFKIQNNESK